MIERDMSDLLLTQMEEHIEALPESQSQKNLTVYIALLRKLIEMNHPKSSNRKPKSQRAVSTE